MKRIILSMALIFAIMLPSLAQTEHVKFMGIPLDGNIDTFTTKLKNKGCTINSINTLVEKGTRVFDGYFSGEEATICVYYNPSNKKVYAAKAYFDCFGKTRTLDSFESFKNNLSQKYGSFDMIESTTDDDYGHEFPKVMIGIRDDDFEMIGLIVMYITCYEYGTNGTHSIHVQYEDLINQLEFEESKMDDL